MSSKLYTILANLFILNYNEYQEISRRSAEMWKRKDLKKKVRVSMRQSYWKMAAVCFVIAVLTTAYPVSATFINLQTSPGPQLSDAAFAPYLPNSEVISQTIKLFLENAPLSGLYSSTVADIIHSVIDLSSTNISVFFTALRAVNSFLSGAPGIAVFLVAAGTVLTFLYQIFISNILQVGEKRFFLEIRSYRHTPVSKIFFLFKLRYLHRPAWVMLCRSVFQTLWNFTIIGGIIKHYEYIMIPFILAENPKISRKDAFFLSKQLTEHNKWKLFLLDLSFAGWKLLSILTLGILDFVIVNPYITGCRSELYLALRRNYVLSRSPRYERLNDSYLEHVPSEDELLISKALYDDSQGPYTQTTYFAPEQYPVFLFSVQPPFRAVHSPVRPDRKYDVFSYILLFCSFSVFGWLLETLIYLIRNGVFTDNSALFGPWQPLYGIFGILSLLFTKRLNKKPALVFFVNFFIYSVLEYALNLISDLTLGHPFRDYSEFFLNLNGRIYVGGCVSFALLGCAFLYYLAPRWTDLFMRMGHAKRAALCAVLCLLFATDTVLTIVVAFS